MRILTICNIFPPGFIGGYELGASEIVRRLASHGHTVEVLTSNYFVDDSGADQAGESAPTIYRTLECTEPNRSPRDEVDHGWVGGFAVARNLRELTRRLVASPPDAVLCFNLYGLGPASILRLLVANGVRPVVYLMDNIFSRMCSHPARGRFEGVVGVSDWHEETRFLFMSQNLREEVETALGMQLPHSQIVPGWFDQRAAAPIPSHGWADVRFVFASRVAGHKGIDVLLDACRRLVDQGFTNFVVDIYGAGEVSITLQRVAALNLRDYVRYQGALEKAELLPRLSEYDALVFPTWYREPFGFIVPEAAAAGCIPVMTFGIGASEWFLDGLDCLKTARAAPGLQGAMARLISMAPEERVQMRRRAHAVAQRLLRLEDSLSCIETALQEAARPPCRNPPVLEAAMSILTEIWRSHPHD